MGKTINRKKDKQHCLYSNPLVALLIIVAHLTVAEYPFISLSLLALFFSFPNCPKPVHHIEQ